MERGKSWVIAVGPEAPPQYDKLACPTLDARAIYARFTADWQASSDHTILLTGKGASTRVATAALLEVLARRSREPDRVLIFASGHIEPNIRGITASLVTSDHDAESPNPGLNLRSLRHWVEDCPAHQVFAILDGCFAGVIAQGSSANTPHHLSLTTGEMEGALATKLFLAAVASSSPAFEREGGEFSLFTSSLITVLDRFVQGSRNLTVPTLIDELQASVNSGALPSSPVLSGVMLGSPILYSGQIAPSPPPEEHVPPWLQTIISQAESRSAQDEDRCLFIADVTVPDGSEHMVGDVVTKIWRVKNVGSVVWVGRFLEHVGSRGVGSIHAPTLTPIPDTEPGEAIDVAVPLRMPANPADVYAEFKMVDSGGEPCFPLRRGLFVKVRVIDPADHV